MKFTGLTSPDMATYGLSWPVQFGRLGGVLKTTVVLGKSPLLVSNSVFIKMRAPTDHDNSRVWFPADKQWLQLQRGQKGHMKMELFNFKTGGALHNADEGLDMKPDPIADRHDFEVNNMNEHALTAASADKDERFETNELGCPAGDAQRAVGTLATNTRGPWAESGDFILADRILRPLQARPGALHDKGDQRGVSTEVLPHAHGPGHDPCYAPMHCRTHESREIGTSGTVRCAGRERSATDLAGDRRRASKPHGHVLRATTRTSLRALHPPLHARPRSRRVP